ncbi:fungal-specific transcription factor domain-containing protein [Aspergillus unguis]
MSPTPPSTTSSSNGGPSPEGQYKVVRKRNRVPLSCGPCRHRKLKCNRAHPCENCVKRGDAHSCTYAQTNSRKKNLANQTASSSPDDMQNRIDRLEGLVLSLMTNGSQSEGPAAAMAAISGTNSTTGSAPHDHDLEIDDDGPIQEESETEQVTKSFGIMKVDNNNRSYYISDAHWASVLSEISEVRNYFSTHKKQYEEQAEKLKATQLPTDVPGSTLLFGAMKVTSRAEIMSSFPSKYTSDMLIARYFNCYDPATHFLHGPTFQAQYNKHWEDPSQTCIVWIGMLFAMMRLSMLSWYREGDEPPEFRGKSLDMAGTFRNLVAMCLTLADYTKPYPYLIECLAFHLHGDYCQTKEADISVWVLNGVIVRLAMRMGYHRDSKAFANITPFQGEMRRRVWAFVRQADLLFSCQVGLPSMVRMADSDTELPRNLYDDDFDENCKELPPSRPPSEPTPLSYLITKSRLANVLGQAIEQSSSLQNISYDKVMEMDAELRRAQDMVPEHLHVRPIEESPLDPLVLIMSRFSVMSVYHRAQCLLHRKYLIRARENPRFTHSRKTCIESALELLRFQSMLHVETRPTGRLRSRQNRVTTLSSSDFLQAATILCLDLYHGYNMGNASRTSPDTYAWGRDRREEILAAVQRSKDIWDELRDETMDAWKAGGVLGVMLSGLKRGPAEGTPVTPAFEPQDEKQSAAMTLGLLSSGMTPTGQNAAFNDMVSKPSEMGVPALGGLPPLGGLGAQDGGLGASSLFNNMFGQMPDMQANLDWDAWDNYIQGSTLDPSGSWFSPMDLQQTSGPLSPPQLAAAQNIPADRLRTVPRTNNPFSTNGFENDNTP